MVDEKGTGKKEKGRSSRLFNRFLYSPRSNYYLAAAILLIAMIPRVFYISIGVLPNGVDEGVDIMAGRMWRFGYDLYSQINTVQAPVMLTIYGLIEADPVIFRLFSTLCSLVIMAFVMWVGYRIGGRHVMVAAGSFMALDLMFLHESRLASLDMFCLLWVVVGIAYLVRLRQSGRKRSATLMGVSFAIASMIKLFGIIATGAVGLILLIDLLSELGVFRRIGVSRFLPPKRSGIKLEHIALFTLSFFLFVLLIMVRYGVMEVIEGTFLNQLNRPISPLSIKLTTFGVFLLLNVIAFPFMFFGIRSLYRRPEGVILIISGFYLLWFMFQATTWFHHLIFLSPVVALTAGIGVIEVSKRWSRRKRFRNVPGITRRVLIYAEVILVLSAAVIGGGFSYLVKERGESIQTRASEILVDLTDEGDFVISGDPIIAVMANRPMPPEMINVAKLQFPDITPENLTRACIEYAVEVVVLAYHLEEMTEFVDFVEGNYTIKALIKDNEFFLDNDVTEYRIFHLPIDSRLRTMDDWGIKCHDVSRE
ncbi:MAG: phospholipid carrier-dependent glycosyltransferase [Candidatus Thermoplasmatota archaeon]|nr:phospholipid carrier-dependent glycosyltransferase [Candidatus Thermoplasmatota archaeon]